jgi:hypothetical protein
MKETIAQFLKIKDFPFTIKDENGDEIYWETSCGVWIKREFDLNGNRIYYENSNGVWYKREYDSDGNVIYWEDSNGLVNDNRPKPVLEITLEEIAKLKGVDVSQIRIKE